MIWKVIKEYPNYSISDTGIVKRNNYTRIDTIGRKLNKTPSNIINCANGNLNTAYGYKWRWA